MFVWATAKWSWSPCCWTSPAGWGEPSAIGKTVWATREDRHIPGRKIQLVLWFLRSGRGDGRPLCQPQSHTDSHRSPLTPPRFAVRTTAHDSLISQLHRRPARNVLLRSQECVCVRGEWLLTAGWASIWYTIWTLSPGSRRREQHIRPARSTDRPERSRILHLGTETTGNNTRKHGNEEVETKWSWKKSNNNSLSWFTTTARLL